MTVQPKHNIEIKANCYNNRIGFTLVEVSIVLVVIGLITGAIIFGQDLIKSSKINAQITQIEKYRAAANAFELKYGYLPGDMPTAEATQYGFQRSTGCSGFAGGGCGNGDGVVANSVASGADFGGGEYQTGEPHLFWLDLYDAGLIKEKITVTAHNNTNSYVAKVPVSNYLPEAKIGDGKYIYVWGNGVRATTGGLAKNDGKTYFALAGVDNFCGANQSCYSPLKNNSTLGFRSHRTLKVADAFAIDKKIDDGLPQFGTVTASYLNMVASWSTTTSWACRADQAGTPYDIAKCWGNPTTTANTATSDSCFDNGGVAGRQQEYSMSQNNGNNETCAISFEK